MPQFPKRQADIFELAYEMVAGLSVSLADFPSVNPGPLSNAFNFYMFAVTDHITAQAAARSATEAKRTSFDQLKSIMKNCLLKSEVDAADSPERLSLIGWGPKAPGQPPAPPTAPRDFRATCQSGGQLKLRWERPASGSAVRNYIIERRQQNEFSGEFDVWSLVGTSLNTEKDLTNQPAGLQLEYRIKAVNPGGQSLASNTAALVL